MIGSYVLTLDLRPDYAACDTSSVIQLRALARVVSMRLGRLKPLPGAGNIPLLNNHAQGLVRDFIWLAKKRNLTVDEFNVKMAELYNWATSPCGAFGLQRVCEVILQDEE